MCRRYGAQHLLWVLLRADFLQVHVLMAITQHTHSACLLVFLVPAWPLHAAAVKCCCCKQAWPREHLAFGCYVCGLVAAVVWQLCLLIAQTNDAVVTQCSPLLFVGCAMVCFQLGRGQPQPAMCTDIIQPCFLQVDVSAPTGLNLGLC